MSALADSWRRKGLAVGFVPTMGALHAGHLSLIRLARETCGRVVVSVFVNPAQFGPKEDLSRYPRPLASDLRLCRQSRADAVFHPSPAAMYPPGFASFVEVEGLSERLCGASRPGHFRGVATVVLKLFSIVRPDLAFFGEKDYQQLVVIRRMVRDLALPVQVIACPTLREPDGLAMSSRNAYLGPQERALAPGIHAALALAARPPARREVRPSPARLLAEARRRILGIPGAVIDYVALADPETLLPPKALKPGQRLLAAVRLGGTRLIDNVTIS
jgi:pantoate--beta-alanine ligase